jgi:hypothetical protein
MSQKSTHVQLKYAHKRQRKPPFYFKTVVENGYWEFKVRPDNTVCGNIGSEKTCFFPLFIWGTLFFL